MESGSSHQASYPNVPSPHDGGYKTNRVINSFLREIRKWIIWVEIVIIINICNKKVVYVVFMSKIPYKSIPYDQ